MTDDLTKELVNAGLITGYRLPIGKEELNPREDEVVVFRDNFVAGLVIPCHQFVLAVLDRYRIHLHELTPNAFAHLCKFIWGMVSYDGDPNFEVFARHFTLHNQ